MMMGAVSVTLTWEGSASLTDGPTSQWPLGQRSGTTAPAGRKHSWLPTASTVTPNAPATTDCSGRSAHDPPDPGHGRPAPPAELAFPLRPWRAKTAPVEPGHGEAGGQVWRWRSNQARVRCQASWAHGAW